MHAGADRRAHPLCVLHIQQAACRAYTWDKKRSTCQLNGAALGSVRLQGKRGVQSARLVDPDAKKPSRPSTA